MATHSSMVAWEIRTEEPGEATVHGVTKSWTWFSWLYSNTSSLMHTFWKSFPITNRHWILSIIFLCLLRWSYGFYSSLYSCGISYWFADTEKNLCIFKINPTWSWCMILLTSCWIQFSIFLRISVLTFFSNTDLQFSFLCVISLSGFGIRVMVASQNDFRSVPSSAIFKLNIAG